MANRDSDKVLGATPMVMRSRPTGFTMQIDVEGERIERRRELKVLLKSDEYSTVGSVSHE